MVVIESKGRTNTYVNFKLKRFKPYFFSIWECPMDDVFGRHFPKLLKDHKDKTRFLKDPK